MCFAFPFPTSDQPTSSHEAFGGSPGDGDCSGHLPEGAVGFFQLETKPADQLSNEKKTRVV